MQRSSAIAQGSCNKAAVDRFHDRDIDELYSVLGTIWEALSPDPCLNAYAKDYKWLTQVYESVKPLSGNGRLLWHRLGAKTIELINENIVERIVTDIDGIVRQVRFDGWQSSSQGEREVKQALRRSLRRFQLHTDQELFDKAYGYIREYY